MVGPVSFQGLQNIQNSQTRYIDAGNGTFRAANEGSWKDKAINWLKETFRPGLVKQENAQAYAAAKQAFIDGGGHHKTADRIFDGQFTTFTPAAIKPAWQHLFTDQVKNSLADTIRENVDIGSSGSTLTMTTSSIDTTQQLSHEFSVDIHRMAVTVGGDLVQKSDPHQPQLSANIAALSSFCALAARHNISKQDIEGISKFVNQSTTIIIKNVLEDPEKSDFKLPNGQRFIPNCNIDSNWAISKNTDGSYRLDFKGESTDPQTDEKAMKDIILYDEASRSVTGVETLGPKSKLSVQFSMTIEMGSNNQMTMRSLDDLRMKLNLFKEDGSRLA